MWSWRILNKHCQLEHRWNDIITCASNTSRVVLEIWSWNKIFRDDLVPQNYLFSHSSILIKNYQYELLNLNLEHYNTTMNNFHNSLCKTYWVHIRRCSPKEDGGCRLFIKVERNKPNRNNVRKWMCFFIAVVNIYIF